MKKRMLALSLAAVLVCGQIMVVNADTIDDLKQQKSQTSSQLAATEDKIDALEDKKQSLLGEIDSLDARLIETIASINNLKDSITTKAAEIEVTKVQLQESEAERDSQYEAMKDRIQYFYENENNGAWLTSLLQEGNLSSMLSSAKNTQEVYDYDKKALEEYVAIVQQVTDLETQLEEEMDELEGMKAEQEVEQQNLEGMLEEKKATCSDYESQIEAANAVAKQYQQVIAQQNAEIQELVAEQQRQAAAAEAARQKAAEEAAQKAAREAASSKPSGSGNSGSSNTGNSGNSGSGNSGGSNSGNNSGSGSKPSDSTSNSGSSSNNGSASGQAVVNYALQFVGNPYVWGGTSLTNGADCSGYIQSVYAHFGYSVPRSSGEQRSAGRGVSYSEAQPGDIICYDGHVAIYMGGGQIVHASNSAPYPKGGIKVSDNAAYKTILAVRRIV